MAASVLGKRSRQVLDAEDLASTLPAPKRQTRRSVPQVYEDRASCSNISIHTSCQASTKGNSANGSRRRVSSATSNRDTKTKHTTKNQLVYIPEFQDENLPPSVIGTPTTIRTKDVYSLKTPQTPRHHVRPTGLPWTPKTQRTSPSKLRGPNPFTAARQAFASSCPTRLVGRETERQQLRGFITDAIAARSGGCTYVSGPPGTGKSALVQDVFQEFEQHEGLDTSIVNCVSLRTATEVYGRLLQDFAPGTTVGKASLKTYLSKLFLNKSRTKLRLVLLDEIDNLLETDCDVLYTIFEWALHQSSSVILVGIANALDLTDRFLPRLRAKGLKPQLLPFLPYSATQVSDIISDKLRSLLPTASTVDAAFVPFMQPTAIQLCGKKIASQTGDLRKAFSLVRRIIDLLEKETIEKQTATSPSKTPLGELANLRSPSSPESVLSGHCDKLAMLSPETAPRASVAHVARVASGIFNNGTISRMNGLNLQQKAVLCSLVSGEKRKAERDPYVTPSKSTNKIPSVKELYVKYSILCKRDEGLLHPLKDTEFRDVVASLETLGLVHEARGSSSSILTPTSTPSRAGRSHDDKQIVSAVSEKEMRESLSGAGTDLLRRLLDES